MNNNNTCATKNSYNEFSMCPHCSSVKYDKLTKKPYWQCNKYNIRLNENDKGFLIKCDPCLNDSN